MAKMTKDTVSGHWVLEAKQTTQNFKKTLKTQGKYIDADIDFDITAQDATVNLGAVDVEVTGGTLVGNDTDKKFVADFPAKTASATVAVTKEGWIGTGGGSSANVNVAEHTAELTYEDYVTLHPEIKPENIRYGVTILGVTGKVLENKEAQEDVSNTSQVRAGIEYWNADGDSKVGTMENAAVTVTCTHAGDTTGTLKPTLKIDKKNTTTYAVKVDTTGPVSKELTVTCTPGVNVGTVGYIEDAGQVTAAGCSVTTTVTIDNTTELELVASTIANATSGTADHTVTSSNEDQYIKVSAGYEAADRIIKVNKMADAGLSTIEINKTQAESQLTIEKGINTETNKYELKVQGTVNAKLDEAKEGYYKGEAGDTVASVELDELLEIDIFDGTFE